MKKIMCLIPDLNLGGAEIMVENLANKLRNQGYDIVVVSLYSKKTVISKRLISKNIQVIYCDKKKGFDIRLIYRLYKLFSLKKPDVVHSHLYAMPYGVLAAFLAKVPLKIHTIHSMATKEVGARKRKINKFLYKFLGVIPVSISPQVKESVIKEYNISDENVIMIYNGIDINNCMKKEDYSIHGDNFNILHVGNFKEAKNHIGLVEGYKIVFDKNPNVVLHLIGSGELEQKIKEKVKLLGLESNIIFHGMQANVYSFLEQADLFVLPSLWEGMPISLIEAMSFGLPIVATNVGGIPDMIRNNISGLLVETESNKISDAICEMINDKFLRENLGKEARNQAKRFSSKNMAEQYIELYERI